MQLGRVHADAGPADAVEPLGEVEQRGDAAGPHVVADGADHVEHVVDVDVSAWYDAAQLAMVEGTSSQVERPEHGA